MPIKPCGVGVGGGGGGGEGGAGLFYSIICDAPSGVLLKE